MLLRRERGDGVGLGRLLWVSAAKELSCSAGGRTRCSGRTCRRDRDMFVIEFSSNEYRVSSFD